MGWVVVCSMLAAAGCNSGVAGDGDGGAGGSTSYTGSGPQTAMATSVAGGCDPEETTVTGGVTVGGGEGGSYESSVVATAAASTGGAGVTTGGGTGDESAVALLVSQLPPNTIWCENEGPCPADMLVLFVDSNGNSCSSPTGFPSNDAVQWRYAIGIPAALQQAGTIVLSGSDVTVIMEQSQTQPNAGATATVGVGPGASSGTLIIHEIDEDEVSFSLSGLEDGSGAYDAERCGS